VAVVQPKEFFSGGIHAFPKHWNTCIERNGDYIEKCVIVYLLCSINYEKKIIKGLRFSFDSPSYMSEQ
jgi:hypothetical protein